jgi:3D (Asp-Asp-Asp) domain-containing protein
MNKSLLAIFQLTSVLGLLASCSLSKVPKAAMAAPLEPGVRYEVRKALGSAESFRPSQLRSRYFVLTPEVPPMLAARSSGTLTVRTTAYCHSEADHVPYGKLSAMGTPLRHGMIRSAAADWSRFPLGTRFRVKGQPGVIYEIDDYGSALVGSNTIDIYCTSQNSMNDWGVRHLDIEVLNWGSYADSLALMKDRLAWPHVRHMVRSIQQRLGIQGPSLSMTTPATAITAPNKLLALGTSRSL